MEESLSNEISLRNKARFQINKKNKVVFLAVALILIGIPLFIGIISRNNSSIIPGISNNKDDISFAHTSLSASENIRQNFITGKYEVDINIDTSDNKVAGVELKLSFDPKILGNVDIINGDFLENPSVIQKTIDKTNGEITYILGSGIGGRGTKGTGTIAVVSFTKISDEDTMIGFLPQTLVFAEGQDKSVLKKTIGTYITTVESNN